MLMEIIANKISFVVYKCLCSISSLTLVSIVVGIPACHAGDHAVDHTIDHAVDHTIYHAGDNTVDHAGEHTEYHMRDHAVDHVGERGMSRV